MYKITGILKIGGVEYCKTAYRKTDKQAKRTFSEWERIGHLSDAGMTRLSRKQFKRLKDWGEI
jgi:hypothetical protein